MEFAPHSRIRKNRSFLVYPIFLCVLALALSSCGAPQVTVLPTTPPGGSSESSGPSSLTAQIGEGSSGSAGDLPETSQTNLDPIFQVRESRFLSADRTIYQSGENSAATDRFKGLSAPLAYAGPVPDSATFVRQPDGDLVSASGEVLTPLTPFPWPPPKPSTRYTFRNSQIGFGQGEYSSFGKVDLTLSSVLRRLGYGSVAYYGVPGGFAMVTRIEQIKSDGSPEEGDRRWSLALPGRFAFWQRDFWKSLVFGDRAYFRILVLVVTDRELGSPKPKPTAKEAIDWLSSGQERLPPHLKRLKYSENHRVIALLYEFQRRDVDPEIQGPIGPPSRLPADRHLRQSQILPSLTSTR